MAAGATENITDFDSEEFYLNARFEFFDFYLTFGEDGGIITTLDIGRRFKLTEVRLHLSVAMASVTDFSIRLSADDIDGAGSAHNLLILSQAMNGLTDFLFQNSAGMLFASDALLVFSMPFLSGSNVIGMNVQGWAVNVG